jgi:ATP-binding protein involved in chromosome partitioning
MRLAGVIENMTSDVFGTGGGAALAEQIGAPLLGTIPLDAALRAAGDMGEPLVVADPEQPTARAITAIAQQLASNRPPGDVKKPLKLVG